jgi:hypothetical protein
MAYLIIQQEQKRRDAAVEQARCNAAFAKDILKRYSKTDALKFDQVRSWLQVVANSQVGLPISHAGGDELEASFPGSSVALSELVLERAGSSVSKKIYVVDDDEVKWVFMMAMDKKVKGTFQRDVIDLGIDVKGLELRPKDFEHALRAWLSYIHNKPLLDEVMLRYGTNEDGQMERDSVRNMLTDLNGGTPPKESALDWVMAEAAAMPLSPGVSALELIKVMSLWYTKDLSLEMPRRKSEAIQASDASATADMEAGAAVSAAGSGQGALQKKSSAWSQSASGSKPSESPRAVAAETSCGTSVCSVS